MDSTLWWALGALALATVACVAVLLVRVLRTRRLLLDAGLPFRDKALFWAALGYTLWPVDLLPDPVYLDDIGVLLVVLRTLHLALRKAGSGVHDTAG
ncbi:YkvA family protein [Streptomyces sp. NPDC089799]|uniref:YkvA family protein n=1 Tax=Streptomyces sp. NPDC089799 TaxID=3155066 RepID=UPI00343C9CCB